MDRKDSTYKHGSWAVREAEKSFFNKNKLLLSIVEKLKSDIENNDPSDKTAQKYINDLLYHYCWKMINDQKTEDQT